FSTVRATRVACATSMYYARLARTSGTGYHSVLQEGIRVRWHGWASNPVGGVRRSQVGSTPAAFRQRAGTKNERLHIRSRETTPDLVVSWGRLRLQDCARRVVRAVGRHPRR